MNLYRLSRIVRNDDKCQFWISKHYIEFYNVSDPMAIGTIVFSDLNANNKRKWEFNINLARYWELR